MFNIFTIIFLVCAFLIVMLFLINWWEMQSGKKMLIVNFRDKLNHKTTYVFHWVKNKSILIFNFVKNQIKMLPKRIVFISHDWWTKISPKIDKFFEKVKSHKNIEK